MTGKLAVARALALALAGVRYRPQGRDPRFGLDCVGLIISVFQLPAERIPGDYRLRGNPIGMVEEHLQLWFAKVERERLRSGDVVLLKIEEQLSHLAVFVENALIHADARVGRVLDTPMPAPWPIASVWRKIEGS